MLALIAIRLAVAHGDAQMAQQEAESLGTRPQETQIWNERLYYLRMFRKTSRYT